MKFTIHVIAEITFTLNSQKFWSRPILAFLATISCKTWISDLTSTLLFTRSALDLLSLPPSHHVQRCPPSRRSWAFSCPKVGSTKGQDGAHYSHALHEGFKQQLVEVKWRPSNNHLERKRTELPEHQKLKKPISSDRLAYAIIDLSRVFIIDPIIGFMYVCPLLRMQMMTDQWHTSGLVIE